MDDGAEVAARAGAVIGEGLGDAVNVTGARVTRDEALNELPGDERAGVGVVDEGIEHVLEIFRAALVGGNLDAVENRLGAVFMKGREEHHGGEVVGGGTPEVVHVGGIGSEGPAGKYFGDLGDGLLVVGRDGDAGRVELEGAVGVELIQTNGEKLHDLARVVLIGGGQRIAAGVKGGLGVAQRGEVNAHQGTEGNVFEELAEVTEGPVDEVIVVMGEVE